jgi:sulfoxide reductase heme-binding subunit YedZ
MSYLWYATRATGEVALLFLTIVLALGVMSAIRVGGRKVPRFVIAGIHRNLTLTGLGFLVVHILTTLLDSYAPIGVLDTLVPFASAYRPIWLGLGTLAFDLLLVLTVTSLLRTRIGLRSWKVLHWTAYGCWVTALIHALGTGSDVRTSAFLFLAGICCAIALAAVGWRIAESGPGRQAFRAGTALFALIVVVAIAGWTLQGPLEPGWAKRSGTPAGLLPKAKATGDGG